MRTLFVYPEFPKTFWSYEKILELVNRKVLLPPLGLVTVAALLPQQWQMKLVDRNVREVTEEEWNWAELVVISGMIVQKSDMAVQIAKAKERGLPVAVGGPFASSTPDAPELNLADFKVLDEGEITLPMFIEAIERGDTNGRFSSNGEKPDVTSTPVPRFDLLELDAYDSMSVQFSRGCPFQCEFCDIIVLYGRKPRTKNPEQLIAELQALYDLGWRRSIFLVDDNFIGNKRNAKLLLPAMREWLSERGYPFSFATEASVDLAADEELLQLMAECRFESVFLGIETPDEASLSVAGKHQNTRSSLEEAVDRITSYGIRVMAGFIIGFDGEQAGAGDRIVRFVSLTGIPAAMMGMLQALPNTGLWHRLEKEGRLIQEKADAKGVNQTNLLNFVPTRPIREIANEYVQAFCQLYEPNAYIDRVTHYYLKMGKPRWHAFYKAEKSDQSSLPSLTDIRALSIVVWRQGFKRNTRFRFWKSLAIIAMRNPKLLEQFLVVLAHNEHFQEYRGVVTKEIQDQMASLPLEPAVSATETNSESNRELQTV
ncbi:B12-binding domain-containing radical SAM protein [Synechococcus lacustris C3-12m-Tous]|uniref:B12-binding domain-containing radical SAM protein n=1 Tax=Synechococcus lacustris TaxID=2116544 RepID=UPI0020CDC9C9|nr:B12-binding domain-containing radical SAM protein [Synechococcus lacustris]MCP9925760.1 B12-binding domain-containing radical SAM protein [Synechococcus lacustris C3-12m-Tous]